MSGQIITERGGVRALREVPSVCLSASASANTSSGKDTAAFIPAVVPALRAAQSSSGVRAVSNTSNSCSSCGSRASTDAKSLAFERSSIIAQTFVIR
jgi:hypothetical protein